MEKQVLNRRKNVELFESIRREYQFGVGTIKGVAREFGVHRRMVREALADAGAQTTGDHRKSAPETRTGGAVHRRDPRERSEGAAQAAAYGAPDLQAVAGRG